MIQNLHIVFSKETITFLDVNIVKCDDGTLHTCVHKKDTNSRQYIELSLYQPISCKKGIPFTNSQGKRYRRITADETIF
jgi:hypothetical protein